MSEHIMKSFDRDLEKLSAMLVSMGQKVAARYGAVAKAVQAKDISAAESFMDGDDAIDDLESEVDTFTLKLLALREPKALDLRVIISAQKIASDLERVSDYCSGLMRQVDKLQGLDIEPYEKIIAKMIVTAGEMIAQINEAFAEQNVEKAMRVWHQDDDLDTDYEKIIAKLQHNLEADGGHMAYGSLLLLARYLERIGDHITNIAEHIYFQVLGEKFPGRK